MERRITRNFLIFCFLAVGVFVIRAAEVEAATLTQNSYRWYVNTNALQPTDPWPAGATNLGENTAITSSDTPPVSGDVLRIRMSVQDSVSTLASGAIFKLQWGANTTCSAVGSWTDVSATGGAGIWRGYDNSTPTDGDALTANLLAASDVSETYEEQNNSTATPSEIAAGQDGEWDWVIENNGAAQGTTYCFRMVYSTGAALDSYSDYPKLITKAYTPLAKNWRWYRDANTETPTDAQFGENVEGQGILSDYPVKLRLTLRESNGIAGENVKMRLQYSTSSNFATATDVIEQGSCVAASVWCYANGSADSDNSALTTSALSDSVVLATHNESGTSSSTYTHAANAVAEWEFTIKAGEAISQGTTYYFRAYYVAGSAAVALDTSETSPSMKAGNFTLSFSVAGLAAGTVTEGVTTDVDATVVSLPFGTLAPNSRVEAAQRLTVTTDAFYGYKILIGSATPIFQTGGATAITATTGTNAAPISWDYNVNVQHGAFGYHAGDDALSSGSARFSSNDTWAAVDSVNREIAYTGMPVASETIDIVFRVEASALQDAGSYTLSDLVYVIVPLY